MFILHLLAWVTGKHQSANVGNVPETPPTPLMNWDTMFTVTGLVNEFVPAKLTVPMPARVRAEAAPEAPVNTKPEKVV